MPDAKWKRRPANGRNMHCLSQKWYNHTVAVQQSVALRQLDARLPVAGG
jgi:hypothetical protein